MSYPKELGRLRGARHGISSEFDSIRNKKNPDVKIDADIDMATAEKIAEVMEPLRPDQRGRVIEGLKEKFGADIFAGDAADPIPKDLRQSSGTVARELAAMVENPTLQKLGEICFHKCVEAWRNSTLIISNKLFLPLELQKETAFNWFEGAQIFVVNHNWAAAFKNSAEFSEGAWHLPYPRTIFEFRISGRRCALATLIGDGYLDEKVRDMRPHQAILNVETSEGWVLGGLFKFSEDGKIQHSLQDMPEQFSLLEPICDLAVNQCRAICISLEAEVAMTEVVRAPHKLNAKRERQGKLPIFDYHVVDLTHRKRYAARLPEPGDFESDHASRRLHWVRAHIRHYPNHKVNIKWHLRGDPDLGFVDKEYRL